MVQFIPANLDTQKLVEEYSPNEVDNFSAEKLIHILHLLHSIPATNKDLEIRNGYIPIYSPILQRRIHNYRQYLDYLIDAKVLETDNHYIVGQKSKGYRFTVKYRTQGLKRVDIHNMGLIRHTKAESKFSNAMRKSHGHLYKWYTKDLQIDYDLAMKFIKKDFKRKVENPELRDFDIKNNQYKDPYNQYASALINVERIAAGEFMINVDGNVHRLHSVISNIRSELRHCLSFRGEQLISIDIKNSQPYLSTVLLRKEFWSNDKTDIISIKDIKNTSIHQYIQSIQEYNSYVMLVNSCIMQAGTDLQRYIDLVTQGTFYEYLADVMVTELGTEYSSRKQVKAAVFQVLFTDNRFLAQEDAAPKRLFKDRFPSVYDLFAIIKRGDKSKLPRLLQHIESQVILKTITKRISVERPTLPVYTIHDSIATTLGNEQYVQMIIEEELLKATGYTPKLSLEPWHPSLMKFSDKQLFIGEQMVKVA